MSGYVLPGEREREREVKKQLSGVLPWSMSLSPRATQGNMVYLCSLAVWKKGGVCAFMMACRGQVAIHSGLCSRHCLIVLRFACSVASLSRCLSHYLPGCLDLHHGILVGYLLGWGSPSTWIAWLAGHSHVPIPPSIVLQEAHTSQL